MTATRSLTRTDGTDVDAGRVAGRPDIELVDTVPARRDRLRAVLVATIAAIVLVVFVILLVHVRLTQSAFELKTAQETLQQRRDLHNKLEVTVADLEAPERIRREARRLGMEEPRIAHYLYSDQVPAADVAAPPAPDTAGEVKARGDEDENVDAADGATEPPDGAEATPSTNATDG